MASACPTCVAFNVSIKSTTHVMSGCQLLAGGPSGVLKKDNNLMS